MKHVAKPLLMAAVFLVSGAASALSDEMPPEPAIMVEGGGSGIAVHSPRRVTQARGGCRRCPGAGLPWGGLREPRVAEVPWGGLGAACPPAGRVSRSALVRVKG
jgi:hypothetical protein